MKRALAILAPLLLALAGCGGSPSADPPSANDSAPLETPAAPLPDVVRIRLETEAGPIVIALDAKNAPVTAANFVRYVDAKRFDGTFFYRAARTKGAKGRGFVQGGIRHSARRAFPPIAHEPSARTGLKHVDGTVSMARAAPAGAMGDFFIVVGGAMPAMDGKPGAPGFAAFGRVEEGMDVVRSILAAPTVANAGRGPMRGQMIERPVRIVSARREP
ncbi:MAG TPA: peptidylprolyl isomerase [Allosphingosinicella sp.]|jgi:peptidyl-prolyl cis-trans isomerase A (cyclophilin A)|nr:peptidylprolyl isomerase [Allosphingosinicella sp.]